MNHRHPCTACGRLETMLYRSAQYLGRELVKEGERICEACRLHRVAQAQRPQLRVVPPADPQA